MMKSCTIGVCRMEDSKLSATNAVATARTMSPEVGAIGMTSVAGRQRSGMMIDNDFQFGTTT